MKMTLIPITDTKCICKNCKKEFIIPKEKMLEDFRQCTFCGSLKWDFKPEEKQIEPINCELSENMENQIKTLDQIKNFIYECTAIKQKTHKNMNISLIAAIGLNNELGVNNNLIWNFAKDMKRFKDLTIGHIVIMGRKTWHDVLNNNDDKPLVDRINIVLTKNPEGEKELYETQLHERSTGFVYFFDSVEEILVICDLLKKNDEVFVIGGAQCYELFMEKANKLYITHIDDTYKEADTFFPNIDVIDEWKIKPEIENFPKFCFAEYNRILK